MLNDKIITVVGRDIINNQTAKTTFKVRGGGYITVASIFDGKISFKDLLVPAIAASIRQDDTMERQAS